jgi:HAD superfamily hydrolase (TIGR01459 family)
MTRVLDRLADVADAYDGFIIDLWGVLHDGVQPYAYSRDTLKALKRADKHVVLLSNAPRPSADVQLRLREMGFADDDYDHLLTSGEDTRRHLRRRTDDFYKGLGEAVYLLGLPKDENILDGVPGRRVTDIRDADYFVNTGVDLGETLDVALPHLEAALDRKLPMICANPDLTIVTRGRTEICAGVLAAWYAERGGVVRYHGKPYPGVYHTCFNELGLGDPKRVLAIGDGLKTDIRGANAAGCDGLLIAGGVHAAEFGLTTASHDDLAQHLPSIERVAAAEGASPTYVSAVFRW